MQNSIINGRYRILRQIGIGGFGFTYLAEDLQLQTRAKCVVKHLKPQINEPEALRLANHLFQQEAEILYRLGGHPNIPSLIAHFKENGEFFLVQEFIEGHTVDREFTGGRRYNQKEIVQFLGQMLEILSFVHSQKVIHRDIKPANLIRRSSDGNIFLIDFGAVKQVNNVAPGMPNANAGFSSVAVGSHGYMPFEQMAGNPNFSSDLYALGLVAIEALTGIKPLELSKNQTTNEFVWSHKVQISPELERFISKLVRDDCRQRFVSANEALAAMNSIAASIGFFQNRPAAASIATVQPLNVNRNFQPPLLNQPAFIPPTVIVPAQRFQQDARLPMLPSEAAALPSNSSGKYVLFGLVGIFFFCGFLYAAGKILNFRWGSLREQTEDSRRALNPTRAEALNTSGSLYEEAVKQADEAAAMEKNATTKFEWEQIANKYKRAAAMLSAIEEKNPSFGAAQEKIKIYRDLAENASKKIETVQNTTNMSNPVSLQPPISNVPSQTVFQSPESNIPRRIASMPPPRKGKMYLAYNSSEGDYIGQGKSVVLTEQDGNFSVQVVRGEVHVKFDGGSDWWSLNLAAPQGLKINNGSYGGAQRCAFHSPTRPGLDFDGSGRGCNRLSGSFNVNQIVYDELYSSVLLLDVTFKQQCEEVGPPLFGRLHYDARL